MLVVEKYLVRCHYGKRASSRKVLVVESTVTVGLYLVASQYYWLALECKAGTRTDTLCGSANTSPPPPHHKLCVRSDSSEQLVSTEQLHSCRFCAKAKALPSSEHALV